MSKDRETNIYDIFESSTLTKVYDSFETHINKVEGKPFLASLQEDVIDSLEWNNISIRLSNSKIPSDHLGVAQLLQRHCYSAWFPMKFLSGHQFTVSEMSALTGWHFMKIQNVSESHSEFFIKHHRETNSDVLFETGFKAIIGSYVNSYISFMESAGLSV
jgi:hypothetical protein